jgi:hypothetical protein
MASPPPFMIRKNSRQDYGNPKLFPMDLKRYESNRPFSKIGILCPEKL